MNTFTARFLRFAERADQLNFLVCKALLVGFFFLQTLIVILRYLFSVGFVELQNAVSYGFAAFCVLIIPLALRANKHVRVDVFRIALGPRACRRLDVGAILILLFPVFFIALWNVTPVVLYSWSILEGSRDTGGLPGYFIVLTALPLMCLLMFIQGLAIVFDKSLMDPLEEKGPV